MDRGVYGNMATLNPSFCAFGLQLQQVKLQINIGVLGFLEVMPNLRG